MEVKKITIDPAYVKENGLIAINTQTILPNTVFTPSEQFIISLPPCEAAGNHKHPRQEALMGLGENLYFLWQDEVGSVHTELMGPRHLFIIPSDVPHAVINKSPDNKAILYEYFDQPFNGVERVNIIEKLEIS